MTLLFCVSIHTVTVARLREINSFDKVMELLNCKVAGWATEVKVILPVPMLPGELMDSVPALITVLP